MQQKKIEITYSHYTSLDEIDLSDRKLIEEAVSMLPSSYSPYSLFRVGSAVALENGVIVKGSNQENAAYPSGLCAERVALFSAGAQFPTHPIKKIAIAACNKNQVTQAAFPCGACLQVLVEYEQRAGAPIKIIIFENTHSILVFESVKQLIPFAFHFPETT